MPTSIASAEMAPLSKQGTTTTQSVEVLWLCSAFSAVDIESRALRAAVEQTVPRLPINVCSSTRVGHYLLHLAGMEMVDMLNASAIGNILRNFRMDRTVLTVSAVAPEHECCVWARSNLWWSLRLSSGFRAHYEWSRLCVIPSFQQGHVLREYSKSAF